MLTLPGRSIRSFLRSSVTPVGRLHPSFLTVRTSLVPRSVTPVGKDERSEDDPREKERVE